MNRPLKLSILVALGLASTQVLALDLGQIQVKSTLNSPLVVEIPLKLDYAGEASQLRVSLATPEEFARAGISRTDLKVPLKFAVVTNAQGQKVVRVTSSEPVSSPYLDFLIQVNWPKGRMLREYTVLLDPPNMPAAAPTTAPRSTSMQSTPPRPAPSSPSTAPTSAAPTASARIHDGKYGPVQAGQSLSEIANATRMSGVSVDQMMLALKSANPDAFFRDNINALKRGAVLRIPTRAETQAQNTQAARSAARQQNQAWLSGAASAPTTVGGAGSTNAGNNATAAGHAGDHLALVPPDQSAKSTRGGNNATVKSLQQNLAQAKETLSNQKQQNVALQSQVKDLEQLKSKNQQLVSMKDAQIAALQKQLAKAHQQAGKPGSAPAASTMPSGTTAIANTPSMPAPATTSAASMAAAHAATAAKPAVIPAQVQSIPAARVAASKPVARTPAAMHKTPRHTPAATPVPVERPWYLQTWAWLVGAAIIIVLILLALFGRRRAAPEVAAGSSLADHFGESPFGSNAVDDVDATDHDHVDAEAEMDSDQRELMQQLAENPDDVGLHLELVSLYYARHDVEGFEGAAEAMYAHVSDPQQPEWLDVVAMGQELAPGHPLFDDGEHSTLLPDTTHGHETLPEFDIDDDAADLEHAEPSTSSSDSDYSYDFNLTPAADSAHHADVEADADSAPTHAEGIDDLADHGPAQDDGEAPASISGVDDGVAQPEEALDDMYSDDPVDTKLDLARAYTDMGDHDGARSMLEEVLNEGSQVQQDVAHKLLEELD